MKNSIKEKLKQLKEVEIEGIKMYQLDDFPTPITKIENLDYFLFYLNIQSIIFYEEGISFPNRLDLFYEDIISPDKLNIEGIKDCIESNKSKLINEKSFIKAQIVYLAESETPTIRIYFIRFNEDGPLQIIGETLLYSQILFKYEEDFFSKERLDTMDELKINAEFIKTLTNTNICPIKFNNGELLPLIEIEKYREEYEN